MSLRDLRQALYSIPGFAGGTLGDQIDRKPPKPQPSPYPKPPKFPLPFPIPKLPILGMNSPENVPLGPDDIGWEGIRNFRRGVGAVPLGGPSIGRREDIVPVSQLPIGPPDEEPDEEELAPITRAIEPSAAPPMGELLGLPSSVPLDRAPVMIRRNDRGRPLSTIGGDSSLERDLELLNAQESYKAPHSWKDLAKASILGFINRGLPGVAANVANYELDPSVRNEMAVGQDAQKTQERIQREILRRKVVGADADNQLDRQYKTAQIERMRHPVEPDRVVGGQIVRRNQSGGYEPVYTGTAKPEKAKPVRRYIIGNRIVEEQPDGSLKEVFTAPDKPEKPEPDIGFTNSNIERNISEAEGEKVKVEQRMAEIPITITEMDAYGQPQVKPNPEYTEHKNRRDALIDQIRRFRADLKAPKTRSGSQSQGFKPARDGKYHYTPEQIRASLQPGQSYEEVVAKLKANPRVVIEQ